MSESRKLHADGDYRFTAGQFDKDRSNASTAIWLLKTPYGSCKVAPTVGNRAWQTGKIVQGSEVAIERACIQALQPMVEDGRISRVRVTVQLVDGVPLADVEFVDTVFGERTTLRKQRIG